MALFHLRSKVFIAPSHVWSKVCKFTPHMDGSNADFAPQMEGSHADFASHMERRHSFRDQIISKVLPILKRELIENHQYFRILYDLCDHF